MWKTPSIAAELKARIDKFKKVVEGNFDEPTVAAFRELVSQRLIAAGRSADAASAGADRLLVEYVFAVFEALHRAVDAQGPAVSAEEAAGKLQSVKAAIEALEQTYGVENVLDCTYRAYHACGSVDGHDPSLDQVVRDFFGPGGIEALRQSASIDGPTDGGGFATRAEPKPSSQGRRPCEECANERAGAPLAQPLLELVVDDLRPDVMDSYRRSMDWESDSSHQVREELQTKEKAAARSSPHERAKLTLYAMRPADPGFKYCGAQEFEGSSNCCQVKNHIDNDEPCDHFKETAEVADNHSCETCRHDYRVPNEVLLCMERVLGRRPEQAGTLREQIRQKLQSQAQTEYEDCLRGTGFLKRRPGTLPVCEKRSNVDSKSRGRWIVGPIVNVASRCDQWEEKMDTSAADQIAAKIEALAADAEQAVANRNNPANSVFSGFSGAGMDGFQKVQAIVHGAYNDPSKQAAANAEADVIEFALATLQVNKDFVSLAGTRYAAEVWHEKRIPQAARARPPTSAPAMPSYAVAPVQHTGGSHASGLVSGSSDAALSPSIVQQVSASGEDLACAVCWVLGLNPQSPDVALLLRTFVNLRLLNLGSQPNTTVSWLWEFIQLWRAIRDAAINPQGLQQVRRMSTGEIVEQLKNDSVFCRLFDPVVIEKLQRAKQ